MQYKSLSQINKGESLVTKSVRKEDYGQSIRCNKLSKMVIRVACIVVLFAFFRNLVVFICFVLYFCLLLAYQNFDVSKSQSLDFRNLILNLFFSFISKYMMLKLKGHMLKTN